MSRLKTMEILEEWGTVSNGPFTQIDGNVVYHNLSYQFAFERLMTQLSTYRAYFTFETRTTLMLISSFIWWAVVEQIRLG